MDTSGQLTFSDDPLLNGSNEAYQLLETGNFTNAVLKIDELLNINPDYPGLIEGYRTARFWHNREKEINILQDGKETADFFMRQWKLFEEYAEIKNMQNSTSYKAVMFFIFHKASEHYKISFKNQEDTTNNFDLLLNLGACFLRLKEYKNTIETLEYARSSYKSDAKLLSILGEAYYQNRDAPKGLLYLKEAFFIDPSEIDLNVIEAKPISMCIDLVKQSNRQYNDIREWIPIYGTIHDVFYVRRNIDKNIIETTNNDIYNLELNYQKMSIDQVEATNILPRLINKYLWMLDYYEFQNYSFEHMVEIRDRLLKLDKELFIDYFKDLKKK